MKPFFTVIVCTYNRERLLPRALDSILAQSCTDWEVVVVDDGSTDATAALLNRYQNRCSELVVVRHDRNRGVGAARNTGVENANGRYITFLDSDDEYVSSHLGNRKQTLQQNPNTQLLHGGLSVFGDPYVVDKEDGRRRIHVDKCAVGGTFFIRNDVFDLIGSFRDLSYADDADFFERAREAGIRIEKTDVQSYVYYRNVPNQITARVSTILGKTQQQNRIEDLINWLLRVVGIQSARLSPNTLLTRRGYERRHADGRRN